MENRLTLLAGESRSGKTWQLLDAYASKLGGGKPCLWIAPSQAAVEGVRDAIARSVERAVLRPGIVTFSQLAESLVQRSGRGLRKISEVERRRLLHNAICEALAAGTLGHFAAVAESPGFQAMLARTIAEWKRRDRWDQDLVADALGPRQRELAELYQRYQSLLLRRELYDKEGVFWAARKYARESQHEFANYELVVVDGFTDFTEAQLDILKLLAQRAERVVVALLIEPQCISTDERGASRRLLFARPIHVYQRLRPLADKVETPHRGGDRWPAADFLRRQLFRDNAAQTQPSPEVVCTADRVHVIAATSPQAELEEVARRVKVDLLRGAAADEIVVALRRLGPTADRIRQVCDDFGLPVLVDRPRSLAAAPLVRSLVRLLQLHAEDWPFQTLLAVVGDRSISALNGLPSSGGGAAKASSQRLPGSRAAIELGVRQAQLPAGRVALLDHLEQGVRSVRPGAEDSNGGDPAASVAAAQCRDGLTLLDGALAQLPTHATVQDWSRALKTLITRLGVGEGDAGDQLNPHWTLLRRGLHSVAQADAASGRDGELLSTGEIAELIAQTAGSIDLPRPSDGVGRVRIVSAETARSLEFKRLYLAGLTEQSFSATAALGDWSGETEVDADRVAMLLDEADPTAAAQADEMLLFYQLVTRPSYSLTLSYAALDDKAQPLPPSPLLTELEQCLAGCPIGRTEMSLGEAQLVEHEAVSTSERRQATVIQALAGNVGPLSELAAPRCPQVDQRDAESTGPQRPGDGNRLRASIVDALAMVASRRQGDQFADYEGVLDDPIVGERLVQRFGPAHLWSASQLETYAECPFRFFGLHVLNLESLPTFSLQDDLSRRGSLMHAALALMHRRLHGSATQGGGFDPEQLQTEFRRAVTELAASPTAKGLNRWLREIERRQIEHWSESLAQQFQQYASQWSDWDEPPTPALFEVRFGPGHRQSESSLQDEASEEAPFELQLAGGPILLTGQIDRVDVGRIGGVEAFNVIDYKSSRRTVAFEQMASGAQVQLPLYALAAERRLLVERGAQAFAAGYWDVRDTGFAKPSKKGGQLRTRRVEGGNLRTTDQWETLQAQLLERIDQIVAGVQRGDFPVFNEDQECTRWCELRTTCRIAQIRSLRKTWTGRAEDRREGP